MTQARRAGWPLWARVASGFGAFFALLTIIWLGTPLILPLIVALSLVGLLEFAAMLRLLGLLVHRTTMLVVTVLLVPAMLPPGHRLQPLPEAWVWSREAVLLGFAFVVFAFATRRPHRNAASTVAFRILGFIWIPLFFSFAVDVREIPDVGFAAALLTALAVVASDVGEFVAGRVWGRHKLAPDVSPDKTVEGAIGGVVLALVVSVVTTELLLLAGTPTPFRSGLAALFGVTVATAGQVGDLFESLIKRWVGVKDAGVFLPGHGGVLDRVDSHLMGIPVAWVFLSLAGVA